MSDRIYGVQWIQDRKLHRLKNPATLEEVNSFKVNLGEYASNIIVYYYLEDIPMDDDQILKTLASVGLDAKIELKRTLKALDEIEKDKNETRR